MTLEVVSVDIMRGKFIAQCNKIEVNGFVIRPYCDCLIEIVFRKILVIFYACNHQLWWHFEGCEQASIDGYISARITKI